MSSAVGPTASDPLASALHDGADRIVVLLLAVDRGSSGASVVIDGRSGAGKSTLASLVRVALVSRGRDVSLVRLDDLYPGWDGLAAGAALAEESVLRPHRDGEAATWHRYDWGADAYAEGHTIAPSDIVIVEGAGALTPASAESADVRVWVEAPEVARRERALARDGETYRPHWDRWADQERLHIVEHRPRELADLIINVP